MVTKAKKLQSREVGPDCSAHITVSFISQIPQAPGLMKTRLKLKKACCRQDKEIPRTLAVPTVAPNWQRKTFPFHVNCPVFLLITVFPFLSFQMSLR